jgi:hypothetical protein
MGADLLVEGWVAGRVLERLQPPRTASDQIGKMFRQLSAMLLILKAL